MDISSSKVIYKGIGNVPKIRKFKTEYSFDRDSNEEPSSQEDTVEIIPGIDVKKGDVPKTDRPEIIKVSSNPLRVKKGETYTITVVLSPHGPDIDECRFSLDGINWQESNVFAGLAPGGYKIFAQNKSKEDLVCITETTLQEGFADKCPSVEEVNALLPKIANDDYNARRKLLDMLGRDTKIKGSAGYPTVSQWVNQCVEVDGVIHKVVAIDCNNGKVNSITIQDK